MISVVGVVECRLGHLDIEYPADFHLRSRRQIGPFKNLMAIEQRPLQASTLQVDGRERDKDIPLCTSVVIFQSRHFRSIVEEGERVCVCVCARDSAAVMSKILRQNARGEFTWVVRPLGLSAWLSDRRVKFEDFGENGREREIKTTPLEYVAGNDVGRLRHGDDDDDGGVGLS